MKLKIPFFVVKQIVWIDKTVFNVHIYQSDKMLAKIKNSISPSELLVLS